MKTDLTHFQEQSIGAWKSFIKDVRKHYSKFDCISLTYGFLLGRGHTSESALEIIEEMKSRKLIKKTWYFGKVAL